MEDLTGRYLKYVGSSKNLTKHLDTIAFINSELVLLNT